MRRGIYHEIRFGGLGMVMVLCVVLSLLAGCSDEDEMVDDEAGEGQSAAGDWWVFRGDRGLSGVSTMEVGDALRLNWEFETGDSVVSSAVIGDGKVFIGSTDGYVYALGLEDGELVWKFRAGDEEVGDMVEAPPLFVRGVIYVGSWDGNMYALGADKGEVRWKFETGDKIVGSANWSELAGHEGGVVVFGSHDEFVYCVDAISGEEVWLVGSGSYVNSACAIEGDIVVYGGCDQLVHFISLSEGVEFGVGEVGGPIAGSTALVGGKVYVGHHAREFVCIDIEKGKVEWKFRDKPNGYYGCAAVVGGRVIFGGRGKWVYCVERESGELIWKFATKGSVDSSPVVCGDRVVVGSGDGRLYILRFGDGC